MIARYGCSARFGSLDEENRHVQIQHLHLKTWQCDVSKFHGQADDPKYDRMDLFKHPVRLMHAHELGTPSVKSADLMQQEDAIVSRCEKRTHLPPSPLRCPYCPYDRKVKSLNTKIAHVERHIQSGNIDPLREKEDVELRRRMINEGKFESKGTHG